ncbi:hypothetical protein [Alteribacter natronophilus]|uniref:hypothetical protein n=1 Tax=Alteribacter natronophilus TaxID=2583810 RepID=UPI00110D3B75|nr:hypothetical protein [Alteribacter natronophilus]TMW72311.1 hypothetical protein FGB90_08875 [Alteribacter natronophilus]
MASQTRAAPAVRTLLSGIVDYAGLFPPASLSLGPAMHNYASYLKDDDAWMLGPFVAPAHRLREILSYINLFSPDQPLRLSVTGRRGEEKQEAERILEKDMQFIREFVKLSDGKAKVEAYEIPLPPITPEAGFLEAVQSLAFEESLEVFCETTHPFDERWQAQTFSWLDTLAKLNKDRDENKLHFKLRTGGVEKDHFPSLKSTAAAMHGACERDIKMKFTAGLHHPFRHFRRELDTMMHGFLNVFTAGVLADCGKADLNKVELILADEDPASFSLTNKMLAWQGIEATEEEIQNARQRYVQSFGSCSFDEPREDLRNLKLLKEG